MITDTIVAQCTPSGAGALALIRLSGSKALFIASNAAQLSSKKLLSEAPTHTIHHGWIVDDNHKIDEVLFFVMHAPRTFTGENTVEISCHNNPFIIENIINRLIVLGARPAQPGEFSRQAVENGKLDILQAEAIKELIHAQSQESLKLSMQQIIGSFSQHIQALEKPMIQAISLCEASFEFLEEEMDFSDQMAELLTAIEQETNRLATLFDQQKQIREGIRIALIGSVNAGKSSLFNALIGKQRAIVTNIAGTTRDVIESSFYNDSLYWTIIDTAGLRQTDDSIEQQGIERSYQEAQTADIILLVIDSSRAMTQQEKTIYQTIIAQYPNKIILIKNKSDLSSASSSLDSNMPILTISAQTGNGMDRLKETIQEKVTSLFSENSSSFLLNKRHNTLLNSFLIELKEARHILTTNKEYELISLHLQKAISLLSELTGKSITEKAMDAIFRDFCIGK
jgi:tRNA modification GTPase